MSVSDPFWHLIVADAVAIAIILVPVFRNHSRLIEWRRDMEHKVKRLDELQRDLKTIVDKGDIEDKAERREIYTRLNSIDKTLAAICQKLEVEA